MKKQLEINIRNVITSYSYYAYPQCIMTAENRIGNKIAEFKILETLKDGWCTKGNIKKDEKGVWEVNSQDPYLRECNGCIYNNLSESRVIISGTAGNEH